MGNWACAGVWPAESWAAPPGWGRAAEGPGRNRARPAVRAAMPPRAVRNERRRMRVLLEAWARNGSGQLLDDADGRAVDLPSRRQWPSSANHVLAQPALEVAVVDQEVVVEQGVGEDHVTGLEGAVHRSQEGGF